jgi:uncharacterized protein YutE (UPF0331/DUF86 family)
MTNPEIIRKRLFKLEHYLGILQRMRRYSYEEFRSNPERYGSAERFLHLSIEAINDIGNHVVADEQLGEVNWQSDIPRLLAQHGYVSHELAESWIRMIGFRNVLVHDYLEIDHRIVYDVITNHLDDLRRLMETFAGFL